MIATDIDGTLLNRQGVIPPENVSAIRDAQKAGITVAVASGRFPENVHLLLEDYGLRCPVIGENGGNIVDEQLRPIQRRLMNGDAARQVQAVLEKNGADYFIFGSHAICTSSASVPHHSELVYGQRITAMGFSYYHGTEAARAFVREGVHKFYVCNNVPLALIRERLRGIDGILITQSGPGNIEIMPEGVDKGRGIQDFAERMGIGLEEVMALGDEENDIPMLAIAGYGVAMGNGSEKTKAAARYVTDTNQNGGFAKAVRRYALQEG
ncbi:MAG: HAD family phosphatase [Clostridia bacterium]|nr:HAD family phosphatase [Clostridia bacterium]